MLKNLVGPPRRSLQGQWRLNHSSYPEIVPQAVDQKNDRVMSQRVLEVCTIHKISDLEVRQSNQRNGDVLTSAHDHLEGESQVRRDLNGFDAFVHRSFLHEPMLGLLVSFHYAIQLSYPWSLKQLYTVAALHLGQPLNTVFGSAHQKMPAVAVTSQETLNNEQNTAPATVQPGA